MKGICFKEPLFHATIEGRKTQTRRIIEPQPSTEVIEAYGQLFDGEITHKYEIKPRYRVGDVVYLKEPYAIRPTKTLYKYGSEKHIVDAYNKCWAVNMPESAARYFIEITAVRAERLQDISEDDCKMEGITAVGSGCFDRFGQEISFYINHSDIKYYPTSCDAYAGLIDEINGKGTWDSNPWVWVYDYKLTEKTE